MVGVPRSKGCRICVQRRVRCDEARPTCNNCKKGNRPCPGYSSDLKFQDEGVKIRKRHEKNNDATVAKIIGYNDEFDPVQAASIDHSGSVADWKADSLSKESDTEQPKIWDVVGLDLKATQRRTFFGLFEGKRSQYLGLTSLFDENDSDTLLPQKLHANSACTGPRFTFANYWVDAAQSPAFFDSISSPNITQNQLITVFKESIAPDSVTIPSQMKNHTRWLKFIPPLTGVNPLLDAAVRGVTLIHIGRLNNSEPFIGESRPYYGTALRLLNQALLDREKGMSNETLCATILLSFYEMFASDSNDSWVRHAGGVSALMKARGPARHRYGFDREILLAYRYTLIIEAFQQDIPCFLNEPEWRKVSLEIHADFKRSGISKDQEGIFDLGEEYFASMVCLPEYCADAQNLVYYMQHPGSPRPKFTRAQVIDRITHGRANFKSTFARFEGAFKKRGHAPTINLNMHDPVVGISYNFTNTYISSTFTGYWTVLTVLNLFLAGLQRDQPDMVALYRTENKDNGLNICRSTAYMLTSSFLGPFFVIFGLKVGLLIFDDPNGAECEWILRKLFDIGENHMGIAKHVPGYRSGMTVEQMIEEFKHSKVEAAQDDSTNTSDVAVTAVEREVSSMSEEQEIADMLDLDLNDLNMGTSQDRMCTDQASEFLDRMNIHDVENDSGISWSRDEEF